MSQTGGLLHALRPRFSDPRFWAIQILVALLAAMDILGDVLLPSEHLVSLVVVILFLVPVIYAALNFGFAGSFATALWCLAVDTPIIFANHRGSVRVEELLQLVAMDAVAVFVASRIDREAAARARAEATQTALHLSERKYRSLFEGSPIAVFLLDAGQVIRDLNPAAARLLQLAAGSAVGRPLLGAAGAAAGPALVRVVTRGGGGPLQIGRPDGSQVWVAPLVTAIENERQGPLVQLQLRDVTEEMQLQASLRAYAHGVVRAQEEERRRIAQDLHDDTIQSLVLLCRRMDALAKTADHTPPVVATGLAAIRRSAETTIQGIRGITRALRPPVLDDLGLVASIRQVVDDLRERTGIDARYRVSGDTRRLPPEVEVGLFRIAQEAVRNVEQHAAAQRISVGLVFRHREVDLRVIDDGVGFTSQATPPQDHLGLVGMRERAELIGGELSIRASPGHGVRIRLRVPV